MKRISLLATILTLSFSTATLAQEAVLIGKLTPTQYKTFVESWSDPKGVIRNVREILPEFSVPARAAIRCRVTEDGVLCFPNPNQPLECPKEVDMEIAGQKGTIKVPVNCVGPDDEGNCECEVAG